LISTLLDWLPSLVLLAALVLLFFGRNWILENIKASVNHEYNSKIESLRADLVKRQSEIDTLRQAALGNRAIRQGVLEKKRIEAVEGLWASVVELSKLSMSAQIMETINFPEAAKSSHNDEKAREFYSAMFSMVPKLPENPTPGFLFRPFVDDVVWAHYSVYSSIIIRSYIQLRALAEGINPALIKDGENIKDLIITVAPEYETYLGQHGSGAFPFLLKDFSERLALSIKRMLEGHEYDQAELQRAQNIIASAAKFSAGTDNPGQ